MIVLVDEWGLNGYANKYTKAQITLFIRRIYIAPPQVSYSEACTPSPSTALEYTFEYMNS